MITESILALEAEVHRNPQNSKAWQYLGQAHAENDKDTQAITCLARAVEVDPQNLEALAALAVSYTNDFNREKALDVLETWLQRHPDYNAIPAGTRPPPAGERDFYMDAWGRHTYVANIFTVHTARSCYLTWCYICTWRLLDNALMTRTQKYRPHQGYYITYLMNMTKLWIVSKLH